MRRLLWTFFAVAVLGSLAGSSGQAASDYPEPVPDHAFVARPSVRRWQRPDTFTRILSGVR